ncbi:hypothetical protein [Amycolatopsis sp. DSM 110486]|uniref:hypothetical protein n=1 Tax=Amycolatopsis sp. DSM 110486 TaxID=2865832 RepID=UPI001C6A7339|nr:hypothetical protein [Amycolatopsis sp. DSM 110486]QYN17605.1 hypothetical protein K1T34_33000 [Amycolatopsis sp. DSM 110486]
MSIRDPHTEFIAVEFARRGYPVTWLNKWCFVAVIGSRAVPFWATRSVLNTQVASHLAKRKDMTDRLLRVAGVSVPEGRVYSRRQAADALVYARQRWPVVVKPAVSPGRMAGASIGVTGPGEFAAAFEKALGVSSRVMVQQTARGHELRMLAVGGRCVSVMRKLPDPATGLPLPGSGYEGITPQVHPFYLAMVERAVAAFPGLGFAGLDVIVRDWTVPGPYAVLEVNSAPGIRGHHTAQLGERVNVAKHIVDEVEAVVA